MEIRKSNEWGTANPVYPPMRGKSK